MILMKIFVFVACCSMFFGPSEAVTAECNYEYENYDVIGSVYQCKIQNILNIKSKYTAVLDKATGTHENMKADENVEMFYAYDKNTEFMPRGLDKIFTNLKGISIRDGRVKEIHQEDLKQYVKLEYLELSYNDIKILEAGLFDYNPQLKFIDIWSNKIVHIDEHVFDNLQKLERLDLIANTCISEKADSNTEVKELINQAKGNCKSKEFPVIKEEIKQLEEATTSGFIKTCQEFVPEVQKIKNQFQQSSISSSAVIKEKILKISNDGVHGQFCMIDGSIVGLDRAFENLDQSAASINQEIKKLLDRIENMQKVNDEKFEALNASMKIIIDKLNKIQEL